MKFFSSFDTHYKNDLVANKCELYGVNQVHSISRSKLFLCTKVIFPLLFALILGLIAGLILYSSLGNIKQSVLLALFIVLGIILPYRIIKHYIDYHMDNCIITPHEIILIEQSGLFKKNVRTLDSSKIKSINIEKESFFKSVFNNGGITFMSDGDKNSLGEIQLDYIYNPEHHRDIINNIFALSSDTSFNGVSK